MGLCGAQNIEKRLDIATLAQHFTVHLGWDFLFGLMMEHGGVLENVLILFGAIKGYTRMSAVLWGGHSSFNIYFLNFIFVKKKQINYALYHYTSKS